MPKEIEVWSVQIDDRGQSHRIPATGYTVVDDLIHFVGDDGVTVFAVPAARLVSITRVTDRAMVLMPGDVLPVYDGEVRRHAEVKHDGNLAGLLCLELAQVAEATA